MRVNSKVIVMGYSYLGKYSIRLQYYQFKIICYITPFTANNDHASEYSPVTTNEKAICNKVFYVILRGNTTFSRWNRAPWPIMSFNITAALAHLWTVSQVPTETRVKDMSSHDTSSLWGKMFWKIFLCLPCVLVFSLDNRSDNVHYQCCLTHPTTYWLNVDEKGIG